jgi:hypothetical protein
VAIGPGIASICGFNSQTLFISTGSSPTAGLSSDDGFGFASNVISPDTLGLDDTFVRRVGGHALRFNCNNTTRNGNFNSWQPPSVGGGSSSSVQYHVAVFYVYFNAFDFTSGLGNEMLCGFRLTGSSGQFWVGIGIQGNGGVNPNFCGLYALTSATSFTIGPVVSSVTVQTGVWYRLEVRVSKTTNPWPIDIGVAVQDGTATTATGNGPANNAVTNTMSGVIVGYQALSRASNRTPMDFSVMDFAYAEGFSTDYPTGPVQVRGYKAASVGTHNLDASPSAFFFSEVSGVDTALTTSETTSWQNLDDSPLTADADGTVVKATLGTPNTPTFIGAGTSVFSANSVAASTTLAPTKNASTAVGDLMILFTESRSRTASCAQPSGWNLVSGFPVASATTSGGQMYVFTRIADGTATDAPSVAWTGLTSGTTGDSCGARIVTYRNVSETVEITSSLTDSTATAAITIQSVTTSTNNDLAVSFSMVVQDLSQTATVTTFTEASDSSTTSGTGHWAYVAHKVQATAGATGTGTITRSSSTSSRMLQITLAFKATRPTTEPTATWYAEYGFEQEPTDTPIAMRCLAYMDVADTSTTGQWEARHVSGTTPTEVSFYNSFGGVGSALVKAGQRANHANDNATWTRALFNAVKLRFGYSSDADPFPILKGAMLEGLFVSNVVTVTPPPADPVIVRQAVQRAATR